MCIGRVYFFYLFESFVWDDLLFICIMENVFDYCFVIIVKYEYILFFVIIINMIFKVFLNGFLILVVRWIEDVWFLREIWEYNVELVYIKVNGILIDLWGWCWGEDDEWLGIRLRIFIVLFRWS